LSDFDLIKTIWTKVDRSLYDLAQPLQVSKDEVAVLVKTCLNYVEDRYIDWYVYNNAPGYRGYYLALYEKFFDSPKIKVMLKSNLYRVPCIESYETRMINFTNEHTDLDALPGLRDIAKVINLSNIQRLTTPKDRLNVAMEVAKIILSNITEHKKKDNGPSEDGLNGEGESVDDALGGKNTDPVPNDVKNDSSFDPEVSESKNKHN